MVGAAAGGRGSLVAWRPGEAGDPEGAGALGAWCPETLGGRGLEGVGALRGWDGQKFVGSFVGTETLTVGRKFFPVFYTNSSPAQKASRNDNSRLQQLSSGMSD